MINNIYREEILEHYREPQNFGKLSSFDVSSKQLNPFCGDEIEIFITYQNGIIDLVSFQGKGCAISIASTSILTEFVKGKKKTMLTKFSEEDMLTLLGVEVSETRKKCALLGWAVLQECLQQVQS